MFKSMKSLVKILTLENEPENCTMKRVNEALLTCADRIKLKKTNRKNLLDFCGCIPEILVQSNTKRAIQKGFIANGMINESFKYCPSYMNIIKTMPKKLSVETLAIVNDYKIIKQLFDEFQKNSIILEDFFDMLGIPDDMSMRGKISRELRRSSIVSRQHSQTLSSKEH